MSAAVRKVVASPAVAASSESGMNLAAMTSAPAENTPPRKRRRLTLVVTTAGVAMGAVMRGLPPRS